MLNFARRKKTDIYTNAKVEYFPGFTRISVADVPIFREPGWEASTHRLPAHKPQSQDNPPQERSISRAKRKIFDIAALNDFSYFLTLTLDKAKIDRKSSQLVSEKAKIWLSNMVKRNGLSYLLVPEYHKDGESIHFHGLVSGHLNFVDSGHKTPGGKPVYNLEDWRYGFSTGIPLTGDKDAVARYIAKYITKDTKKIFGNFYYAGGHIQRRPECEYVNLVYDEMDAFPHYVPELGVNFKYLTVKGVVA